MSEDPSEPGSELRPAESSSAALEGNDEIVEAELVDDEESPADHSEDAPQAASEPQRVPRILTRNVTVVLWLAGVLVAALLLVALFLIGTRLAATDAPMPVPTATPTETITPTPSATALPAGPVDPGIHAWDTLRGGECLDPYESAWQTEYTVVDCAVPHRAQLVVRGMFADAPDSAYPGFEQLGTRMNLLCTSTTVIDYSVAGSFTDIQVEASFAVDETEWNDGDRFYFCFLSRSSGEPFTTSITVPR